MTRESNGTEIRDTRAAMKQHIGDTHEKQKAFPFPPSIEHLVNDLIYIDPPLETLPYTNYGTCLYGKVFQLL